MNPSRPTPPDVRDVRRAWHDSPCFIGILLALLSALVYSNTFHGKFLYDDYVDILDNPSIRQLWPPGNLFCSTSGGVRHLLNRPIPNLTFALNYAMGGLNTFPYHLTNLIIHISAGLSLFGAIRRTLRRPVLGSLYYREATTLAALIALFWILHPLQTESVAYVTQRYESLMGMFSLLSFYAAIRSMEPDASWLWTALCPLACLLALGSKEVAVALPLLILLFDRAFDSGSFRTALTRHRPLYLGLLLAWVCFGLLQLKTGGRARWAGFGLETPWWRYALSQPGVILHYLRLVFWPHPLLLDYIWPISRKWTEILPGVLTVGPLLAATVVALFRKPCAGFLGAWFFLFLAPTSSVMPILDLAVEHRMYLPLAPVVATTVLGGLAISQWLTTTKKVSGRTLRLGTLVMIAGVTASLGATTFLRNEDYRSPLDIWQDAVAQVPWNPRAHLNYAHALNEAGFSAAAIEHYQTTIALAPLDPKAYNNLGVLYGMQDRIQDSLKMLRKAILLDPEEPNYYVNLGVTLMRKGSVDNAIICFHRAIELNPNLASGHNNIGQALLRKQETQQAIGYFKTSISLQPQDPLFHSNLGYALLEAGRREEGIQELQLSAQLDPDWASGQSGLAWVFHRLHRDQEALALLRKVLDTQPDHITSLFRLSWLLSSLPDASLRNGPEASSLAEQILRKDPSRSPDVLDLVAAAEAECGRFEKAIGTLQEALQKTNDPSKILGMQQRLSLYRKHQPYRETEAPAGPGIAPVQLSSLVPRTAGNQKTASTRRP